jgi:hypothetical protein
MPAGGNKLVPAGQHFLTALEPFMSKWNHSAGAGFRQAEAIAECGVGRAADAIASAWRKDARPFGMAEAGGLFARLAWPYALATAAPAEQTFRSA